MRKAVLVVLVCLVVVGWMPTIGLAQDMSGAELAAAVKELQRQVAENKAELARLRVQLQVKDEELAASQETIRRLEGRGVEPSAPGLRTPVVETQVAKPKGDSQFGFLVGAATGPYNQDWGYLVGGFYDFTIVPEDALGNRLSGEVFVTFSRHDEDFNTLTSPLGIVQNNVEVDIDTLTVALDLKYSIERWEKITPYVVGGPAIYVLGHEPRDQFVAGIAPLPVELSQHDYPSGNADLEWGLNLGLGVDVELTELLHVGLDGRYNLVTDANNQFLTLGGYVAFEF